MGGEGVPQKGHEMRWGAWHPVKGIGRRGTVELGESEKPSHVGVLAIGICSPNTC